VLNRADYLEATRRFKEKKTHARERTRYHALLLVSKGYTYAQTADILFVDEDSLTRWVESYRLEGLEGLKNHQSWGGEHGQRRLSDDDVTQLGTLLDTEAMPGTEVGSGWTVRAIRVLVEERFDVRYSARGMRKVLRQAGRSYQRGRKLYIRRSEAEQARYEAETRAALAAVAASGERVTPLAGDQTRVSLEATIGRRWSRVGTQPLIPDGARSKQAENIYGAVHLGTGEEVAPLCVDWQDTEATIWWLEAVVREIPRGTILLWLDGGPHQASAEVEEWIARHPRVQVIRFPAYTPEENPKEQTWKVLKDEVSHNCWHATVDDLREAVDGFYQKAWRHTVNFLQGFGYFWERGRIYPLPQTQ
jgi:transposase